MKSVFARTRGVFPHHLTDVNGDGLPDILGATDSGLYWQLNTGNGFGPQQRADNTIRPQYGWFETSIHNRVWITDINGDGLSDIVDATDSGLYWQRSGVTVGFFMAICWLLSQAVPVPRPTSSINP